MEQKNLGKKAFLGFLSIWGVRPEILINYFGSLSVPHEKKIRSNSQEK